MREPSQGEALITWAIWTVLVAVVVVTYSRIGPEETYHVSRDGIVGGLSRAVTVVNFPFGLVAIALILVAMAVLPAAAWWVAGPALALCATIPLFNEQANLDAHWGNAVPALGALLALALTVAAARRTGPRLAPRRPWDRWRIALAVLVGLVSLPWITAELGFHFPGDFFMGEELGRETDGTIIAAVHLGHHHGTDGALLVLSALLLTRVFVRPGAMRLAVFASLGALLAYGGVNFAQDAWHEQIVKRGWTDTGIPSAILPGLEPIWAVIVGLAVVFTIVLLREDKRTPL
jgi:hypothetical protein